jgi:hypothetical protein
MSEHSQPEGARPPPEPPDPDANTGPTEEQRLRALIRAAVSYEAPGYCPLCAHAPNSHRADCPWPALVAEAEMP